MSNKEKGSAKRVTKAGMLRDNASPAESEEGNLEEASETTPKISKEKAEEEHEDRPVH